MHPVVPSEMETETPFPPAIGAKQRGHKQYRASLVTKILGDLARESPAKSSYVVGLLTTKTAYDVEKLKSVLADRLLTIPRFRSAYMFKARKPYFMQLDDDELDLDYHFKTPFQNKKPSFQEVIDYIGNVMKTAPLDFEKPLWQFTLVPEMDDGKGLVVTNISHILGDGISQTEVLYRMLDEDALQSKISARPKDKRNKQRVGTFRKARIFIGGVLEGVFSVFGRPDPPNSLKLKSVTEVSVAKRQAFTAKIPLSRCKDIKDKIEGATLNDVFMVLMTMVLRNYYEGRNEKVSKISASFPVNLRKSPTENFDKYGSPHNVWAYGILNFNLKYKNATDLFRKLKRQLDIAKLSPTPVVQQKLGAMIFPFLNLKGRNALALNLGNKCTAQLSNVPGPQSVVTIGGYVIEDLSFQLFSPLGLYLGLITYNGTLSCSINADATIADPAEISKYWLPAFEDLYAEITSHEGMIKL